MPSPAGSPSAVTTAIRKLQGQVTTLEKEIAVLKAEVEAQDKRIADGIGLHGAKVGLLANQTSMLTIVIALGVLVSGFLGYWKAGEIARDQAKEWIKGNEIELRAEIENLKNLAKQTSGEIRAQKVSVEEYGKKIKNDMDRALLAISKQQEIPREVSDSLEQGLAQISKKPRSEWTADDFS